MNNGFHGNNEMENDSTFSYLHERERHGEWDAQRMQEMKLTSILGQAVILQINHGKLIISDCTWWHMMTSLWHAVTLVTAIKSSQLSKVIHGRLATGHKCPIAANGFIWDYNWIIFFSTFDCFWWHLFLRIPVWSISPNYLRWYLIIPKI